MKKAKVKWPVRELMVRRQRRLLKRWLRYAENLKATEEEMIDHCWPETGKGLDDWDDEEDELGSSEDLKNCQEGRELEIPVFHEGNELRSVEDLTDCQEDSQGISIFQEGNDQRSLRDLEDCQEGSGSVPNCQEGSGSIEDCQEGSRSMSNCQVGRDENLGLAGSLMDSLESSIQQGVLMKMGSVDLMVCQGSSGSIPYCQVGRDEQMRPSVGLINSEVSWNQPEELTEQMDLDQQVQLTEVKDQDGILMIGGIGIFLPSAQEEAEIVLQMMQQQEKNSHQMTVKENWSRLWELPKQKKEKRE
jgi:hypothetical protein